MCPYDDYYSAHTEKYITLKTNDILMNKRVAVIWVSWALILSYAIIFIEESPSCKATTITVDISGSGDYFKIQDAINASNDGDTVFVYNGTYNENLEVNKTISLVGEDKESTFIIGNGSGVVISIKAHWINITGFTISNGNYGLVLIDYSNNTISNNIITRHNYGCIIIDSSSHNMIYGNEISKSGGGIGIGTLDLTSSNSIVSNRICDNSVGISFSDYSIPQVTPHGIVNHTISHNNISNNSNGISFYVLDFGVIFQIEILSSKISMNGEGITFSNSGGMIDEITIWNCTIEYNAVGIKMYQSNGDKEISYNNINYNTQHAIYLQNSGNNIFHHNNFIKNGYIPQVVDDPGSNRWDNSYPGGGNFWSDYIGVDRYNGLGQNIPGNDGIGDTPYIIYSDSQDNYPLKYPIGDCIFLYEGWNLVSIPFIQPDTDLRIVLGPISGSYDAVQWYNTSDSSDNWKDYHISKPFPDEFDIINHTIGFWIHVTEPGGVLFDYPGIKPIQNQNISLQKGWNLVGYPSLSGYNRTNGLNNILYGTEVDAVQWYDSGTKTWNVMEENDIFIPGIGYWLHSNVDTVWEVPL
jgi:parallel beta-helix repeat protein